MSTCFRIVILASLLSGFSVNLSSQTLSGVVRDASGTALQGASVAIPALHRGVSTDANGTFSIPDLPPGHYLVEITHIGYREEARRIAVTAGGASLVVELHGTPLELPAVTVTAEAQPAAVRNTALPATVLEGRALQRARGQSLGETIVGLPGVAGYSGGPFSVKPVIRGLSGQRVVVLSDGSRLESQTWDDPQSPEIDVLDLDAIEIVRGPSSVLFGSDALGGVVNAVRSGLPSSEDGAPPLRGTVLLNAFSNTRQAAGGLSLEGAAGAWGYRANVSARAAGDYSAPAGRTDAGTRVPAGRVFNTGASEIDASLRADLRRDWGILSFDAAHFGQTYLIAPEPGRMEYELNVNTMRYDSLPAAPKQEILHDAAGLAAALPSPLGRVEIRGSWQRDSRREEGVAESEEDEQKKEQLGIKPEAELVLNTASFEAKLHHDPVGPVYGTAGVSASLQSNATNGRKPVIPAFGSSTVAGYLYEILHAGARVRFSGGARFEARHLAADANADLGTPSTTRNFQAAVGSAGAAWDVFEALTLAVNAGRGWRAPVAAELFFNGADEGAVRYKVGDPALTPETSLELDASLRYATAAVTAECSVFRNRIADYIFLARTGRRADGLDVYRYSRTGAEFTGAEASVQATPAPWLAFDVHADMVRGTDTDHDTPLPWIPADRVSAGVRLMRQDLWGMRDGALWVRVRRCLPQNRPGPLESATPAYTLWSAGAGADVPVAGIVAQCDLSVENLFDAAYFDHLSRYKAYALDPGRDVVLRVSVPFDAWKAQAR